MSILDRYILKNLLVSLTVATVSLLGLLWLINALKFLDWFINKGLSVWTFLKVTWILMPGFLTVFVPIALFAVTLFVYSRLSYDRELVVMRSAGMSVWRLGRPALILCTALTLVGYVLTLEVVPSLERVFDDIKTSVRDDISSLVLREGQFTQVNRNITVYLGERAADGTLKNIVIYDTGNPEKSATVLAKSGALVMDQGPPRFVLIDGNRQEWDYRNRRASFLYFDSYSLMFRSDDTSGGYRYRKENQRSFRDLVTLKAGDIPDVEYPTPLTENQVRRLRLEAHQRLLQPLNHFGFVMIALGAVLTSQFRRRSNSRPVLLAVFLVVCFQALDLSSGSLAKRSWTGLVLYDVAVVLPILVGLLWMANVPRRLMDAIVTARASAVHARGAS
ncbi:LptF/LptG family permease [Phaeovibrio sulfidiphilus]|uniref:LptF/LptG family permease n=1 Tax=Phaeovibrio sulfidiphilus TaxID=1220600 RepID=A0A8J7CP69_9PROT|nr:LptF/LptG family permease [Phaeovibrio sulfidiphilus]MBE1236707.1 LptF/LptG family permease [Phaeovibrio sulfidiphilus]